MLTFGFAGNLRRHFRQIAMNVDTPAQGLRLLLAQCPAFKRDFYNTRIRMRINGSDVCGENLEFHMNRRVKDGTRVLIVPVVEGSISAVAAAWIMVAVSVASVAYSLYMTSHMKTGTSADQTRTLSLTTHLPVRKTESVRDVLYRYCLVRWLWAVT